MVTKQGWVFTATRQKVRKDFAGDFCIFSCKFERLGSLVNAASNEFTDATKILSREKVAQLLRVA